MPTQDDFILRYGRQSFRHAQAIFQGLRDGSVALHSASDASRQLNSQYSDLYRFRLTHIRETSASEHGLAIAADIEDLCAGLERQPDSPCDLWIFFTHPPRFSYSVFVSRSDDTVAGCFRGVDTSLLSVDELAALWGRHQT